MKTPPHRLHIPRRGGGSGAGKVAVVDGPDPVPDRPVVHDLDPLRRVFATASMHRARNMKLFFTFRYQMSHAFTSQERRFSFQFDPACLKGLL